MMLIAIRFRGKQWTHSQLITKTNPVRLMSLMYVLCLMVEVKHENALNACCSVFFSRHVKIYQELYSVIFYSWLTCESPE